MRFGIADKLDSGCWRSSGNAWLRFRGRSVAALVMKSLISARPCQGGAGKSEYRIVRKHADIPFDIQRVVRMRIFTIKVWMAA